MKAAVCERYGPPEAVVVQDVPMPVVGDGDVLIRVTASAVNIADVRIRALRVPRGLSLPTRLAMGILRPRHPVFGLEVAGVVESVGVAVRTFKRGDRVVASRGFKLGGHAEYMVVAETGAIATIPDAVSDADAVALLFGGVTALVFFDRGKLRAGEHILVNGAAGAVGTMAVQIAKRRGAEVTGVCSAANVELVRSLGADHVIDYGSRDFTQDAARYDLVMDNVGNAPYARIRQLLKPGGRFLMVIGDLPQMLAALGQKDVVSSSSEAAAFSASNYRLLLDMAAAGQIRAVIDRSFPLEHIAEAHRLVDTGHKRGSVIIAMGAAARG
ncbi:MAG TPA: NAD(P)-dependent alcohol dehydrogenase [Polyangiales bacterium]|nr:NAD(P)-dependent alcohol dehydrogenase [Polyangiales bacterium]